MNVLATVKALNERAAREKWYHVCDPGLSFNDPSHKQLLKLWRDKAGDRPMPKRSEMSLRDLKDVLRHLVVFERIGQMPSRYRVRLIGTSLTGMAGDQTGKMIDEIVLPEHLPRWVECCDLILDGGQPMRFLGRVHLEGREYLDAENLFVPLSNDEGKPTFAMGLCRYTPRHSESEESWESMIASVPGIQ
ncbi:MAG: PAS domain-containing protein [Alphaproteobacteria bacterium]|nr:PAS domain-containing protein [Alphaproteobacteria bacterium]